MPKYRDWLKDESARLTLTNAGLNRLPKAAQTLLEQAVVVRRTENYVPEDLNKIFVEMENLEVIPRKWRKNILAIVESVSESDRSIRK